MARKKKVVLEPAGKDLKQFQAKYASTWKQIIDTPAYQAGIQFLRNRKLDSIANLNEEQMEKNSREYLADLRGFLQLENEMATLHEMTEFTLPFEEPEVYLSPEQVEENQRQIAKYQEENRRKRYAT